MGIHIKSTTETDAADHSTISDQGEINHREPSNKLCISSRVSTFKLGNKDKNIIT